MVIYWGVPQSILRVSFWSFLCVDIQREFAPHLLTTQYKEHYFPASNYFPFLDLKIVINTHPNVCM